MRRVFVVTASCFALAACSGVSMPSFEFPSMQSTPAPSTLEFESEPPGADVKTSTGQGCKTPCALSVTANELSVTFTLAGYQPQTVPVKVLQASEGVDPATGQMPPPRMTPNPVYAELMLAPAVRRAPPAASKPAPAKKKPKTTAKPKPPAAEPTMAAPPGSAPASPWPAPTR